MTAPPVRTLSNRELLEEAAEALRFVRELLAELEPLLAIARSMSSPAGGPSYVQAAGLRRALRKGRPDASTAPRPATPGPGPGPGPGPAELGHR
jgi:hypothetical protein